MKLERLIVVEPFLSAVDFYSEPLPSSDIRIFKVSRPSGNIQVLDVNEVTVKCVLLPYKSKHVAGSLLHTLQ